MSCGENFKTQTGRGILKAVKVIQVVAAHKKGRGGTADADGIRGDSEWFVPGLRDYVALGSKIDKNYKIAARLTDPNKIAVFGGRARIPNECLLSHVTMSLLAIL